MTTGTTERMHDTILKAARLAEDLSTHADEPAVRNVAADTLEWLLSLECVFSSRYPEVYRTINTPGRTAWRLDG